MAPSSRAAFLCSAQRIDLESGCYRFHPTGHQAAPFRPNGMLWTSLDRKSQCFHLSSSELLLQFCHCMLILGRVGEDSCCFLHRRWWILRPNAKISSGKKHLVAHQTLALRLLHLVVIRAAFAIPGFSETLARSRHHSASRLCEAQDLGRPH